jgi:hypothetical protein
LNRYPGVKVRLAALRDERQRASRASAQRAAFSTGSTTAFRLRRIQDERDAMAQRVAILSLALQDLERRNASLVQLLHKYQVAVPLELVADNTRSEKL